MTKHENESGIDIGIQAFAEGISMAAEETAGFPGHLLMCIVNNTLIKHGVKPIWPKEKKSRNKSKKGGTPFNNE